MKLVTPLTHKHSVSLVSNENDIHKILSQCKMILWINVILTALASTNKLLSRFYSPSVIITLPTTIMLLTGTEETHIPHRIILLVIDDSSSATPLLRACGCWHATGVKLWRACLDQVEFYTCYCKYSQMSADSEVYVLAWL